MDENSLPGTNCSFPLRIFDNNGTLCEPVVVQLRNFRPLENKNAVGSCGQGKLFDGHHSYKYFFFSSSLADQITRDGFLDHYHLDGTWGDILLLKQTHIPHVKTKKGNTAVVIDDYEVFGMRTPFSESDGVEFPGNNQVPTASKDVQSTSHLNADGPDPMDTSPSTSENRLSEPPSAAPNWNIDGTESSDTSLPPTPPPGSIGCFGTLAPLQRADSPSEATMGTSRTIVPPSTIYNASAGTLRPLAGSTSLSVLSNALLEGADSDMPFRSTPPPTTSRTGVSSAPSTPMKTAGSPTKSGPSGSSPQKSTSKVIAINLIGLNRVRNWKIRGKCTQKGDLRFFDNGIKKVLNLVIEDETGRVRIVCWDERADRINEAVQLNCSYIIAGMDVQMGHRIFNKTGHPFELKLHRNFEIVQCDDVNIKQETASLDLTERHIGEVIDVLAIVHGYEPIDDFESNGRPLSKREVYLIDKDDNVVIYTLWEDDARRFDEDAKGQVVLLKSVRVTEFRGRLGLGKISQTTWELNPHLPEATELLQWYSSEYGTEDLSDDDDEMDVADYNLTSIEDTLAAGEDLIGAYFSIKAKIADFDIKKMYRACLNCKTKIPKYDVLNVQTQGMHNYKWFKCNACDGFEPIFNWGYVAELELTDGSICIPVTAFGKEMDKVFNKTAGEIGELIEINDLPYRRLIEEAKSKEYIWKIKAKAEGYSRIRDVQYVVQSIEQEGREETNADPTKPAPGMNLAEALAAMDQE